MSLLHPKHNVDSGGPINWRRITEAQAITEADATYLKTRRGVFVWRKFKAKSILIYRVGISAVLDGRTPAATTPGPLAPIFKEG